MPNRSVDIRNWGKKLNEKRWRGAYIVRIKDCNRSTVALDRGGGRFERSLGRLNRSRQLDRRNGRFNRGGQ